MTAICPWCGYNLTADAPVKRGDWVIHNRWAIYKGEFVTGFTPGQLNILHAVASSHGYVAVDALGNRLKDDASESLVRVHKHRIAQIMRNRGIPCPISGTSNQGYRWADWSQAPRRATPADMPPEATYLLGEAA